MSGNKFRNAVKEYIENWNRNYNLGIKIKLEQPLGYRFLNNLRIIDILLYRNNRFLGIECKYQGVSGTAYQKLIYTLEDCKTTPIPTIIVFAGNGIKEDVKSKLITSGYGIEVLYEDGLVKEKGFPVLLQRIAIELGIDWFDMDIFNKKGERYENS
ncbi:hypothetical protein SULAZ_1022 [Sulfurihydrogenibium azorense Az-Fu1]|jgi:hypothetical protein|uniref:PD-(D/E)XK nuclease domain-containing protein n=1 Tax=Sulfurihydrogenibium azorense (strain DSM 15241 / OCM 825 / Az-Fu1) TaxID=204536 RepID=C1DV58_SULAA|nr:PD-(D/E)XK nuclease superfamily protein [Sulfurihydrogenibium azorense]ACN98361.1 hypothetical protein SULAZ_1022 [Sulfurihydrogenibium azorense Az-Fu1]MDM7273189.1 hypothetical protein [Sulfurihydrogenibium azorense]